MADATKETREEKEGQAKAAPDATPGVEVVDDTPTPEVTGEGEELRVIEPEVIEVSESEAEKIRRKKEQEAAPRPKSQFGMMLLLFGVLFIMIDPNLRNLMATGTGVLLNPTIGFDGEYPILTIIIAGGIMVTLSTIVRHFFIDWIKMAKTQNTMRAFQKEFGEARRNKDQKRLNELQKAQMQLMGLQTEMSSSQMKPMAATMLVIIPMFAWLWTFVSTLDYTFFSTPWNLEVDMFTTNGILFGSSILPHWILLYSVMSIPFGQLLQKGLKVWSWRKRVDHVLSDHPDVHEARTD